LHVILLGLGYRAYPSFDNRSKAIEKLVDIDLSSQAPARADPSEAEVKPKVERVEDLKSEICELKFFA
jgi:hypothetical protein